MFIESAEVSSNCTKELATCLTSVNHIQFAEKVPLKLKEEAAGLRESSPLSITMRTTDMLNTHPDVLPIPGDDSLEESGHVQQSCKSSSHFQTIQQENCVNLSDQTNCTEQIYWFASDTDNDTDTDRIALTPHPDTLSSPPISRNGDDNRAEFSSNNLCLGTKSNVGADSMLLPLSVGDMNINVPSGNISSDNLSYENDQRTGAVQSSIRNFSKDDVVSSASANCSSSSSNNSSNSSSSSTTTGTCRRASDQQIADAMAGNLILNTAGRGQKGVGISGSSSLLDSTFKRKQNRHTLGHDANNELNIEQRIKVNIHSTSSSTSTSIASSFLLNGHSDNDQQTKLFVQNTVGNVGDSKVPNLSPQKRTKYPNNEDN